ncbi:MAG: hypothetical protein Q4G67_03685 [Actinomycetia bacterium]|nr:hypothetical protein [Actinomycetes bacterium]
MTMTTSTSPTPPPTSLPSPQQDHARQGSPPWLRLARLMLGAHAVVTAWTVATLIVVGIGILFAVSRLTEPSMSAFQYVVPVATWVSFGVSIVLIASYLRTYLAAGVSRRSVVRGGILAALAAGAMYSVAGTAMLLGERWAYSRLGWVHGYGDGTTKLVLERGIPQYLWGAFVVVSVMALSGLLVGATFMRYRAWATLLLPATALLPLLAIAVSVPGPRTATVSGTSIHEAIFGEASPLLGIVLPLVVLAAVAAAVWLALRAIPSRPPVG